MTARYGRNQLEISRLRDVMTVGKELIEIEESLTNAPKDLNERTNLFVKTQELLKSFDNTKFENVEIIKGYVFIFVASNSLLFQLRLPTESNRSGQ